MFRYTTAITRGVSASLPAEAQRMDDKGSISLEKARQQHENYVSILRDKLGLRVIELPADDTQPDCVFVEDPVVAIGNRALLTTPGHESRRPEVGPMKECVEKLGMEVISMEEKDPNARMDGGDVLFTGQEIFVGISARTNDAGMKVLAAAFPEYPVSPVPVGGALHLKSGCSMGTPGVILQGIASQEQIAMMKSLKHAAKKNYSYKEVGGRNVGANCLYIDSPKLGPVIVHQPFENLPESKKAYEDIDNLTLISCDQGEFDKVDGALTCCSVLLTI